MTGVPAAADRQPLHAVSSPTQPHHAERQPHFLQAPAQQPTQPPRPLLVEALRRPVVGVPAPPVLLRAMPAAGAVKRSCGCATQPCIHVMPT
mmetsp:Transcript_13806/g.39753  ORF Transcript_13806/g.39753 Transcript_13806/m.39753 type:complete len:92 (-) Transcript_13806:128-403(-)